MDQFIIIGDRVLLKPKKDNLKTDSGLYLPPGVKDKESIQSAYVLKVGPGYPIPSGDNSSENWRKSSENVEYIPLQANEGDLAIYLQNQAHEITYEKETYIIAPQSAILLLIRE